MNIGVVEYLVPLRTIAEECPLILHRATVKVWVPQLVRNSKEIEALPTNSNLGRDVIMRAACLFLVDVEDVFGGFPRRGDVREVCG